MSTSEMYKVTAVVRAAMQNCFKLLSTSQTMDLLQAHFSGQISQGEQRLPYSHLKELNIGIWALLGAMDSWTVRQTAGPKRPLFTSMLWKEIMLSFT